MRSIRMKKRKFLKEIKLGEWTKNLPIQIQGKNKSVFNNQLLITEFKKKSPSLELIFYRQIKGENLKVLNGKKILVTIEIFE